MNNESGILEACHISVLESTQFFFICKAFNIYKRTVICANFGQYIEIALGLKNVTSKKNSYKLKKRTSKKATNKASETHREKKNMAI